MSPNQNTRAWTLGRYCKHSKSRARRLSTGLSPSVAIRVSNALRVQARTTSSAPPPEEGGYARIRLNTQVTSLRSSEATSTREARAMHSSQAWGWRGTVPKASPRKGT